jgi:mono/diheme cytochrome c family protein
MRLALRPSDVRPAAWEIVASQPFRLICLALLVGAVVALGAERLFAEEPAAANPPEVAPAVNEPSPGSDSAPATGGSRSAIRSGEKIYREHCSVCHGVGGEGVKDKHNHPLVGDHSLAELTNLIAKTMPEDNPGSCVGEDAHRVATYVYDRFYSPIAQARNQRARIELARLTARQHRQIVGDLIAGFRWNTDWGSERGLKGEYFQGEWHNHKKLERVDPAVHFDFHGDSPVPGQIEPGEFSIVWHGSVYAPETGEYTFIVESENSSSLWVNDPKHPLIDGRVKSGKDLATQETLWLVGGRAYGVRLELRKSKKSKDQTASMALKWRLPRREPELIPTRYLSTKDSPATLIVATRFPPDDRSAGYERGSSISKAWDQAATEVALETADYVIANLDELTKPTGGSKELRRFADRFVERAFRRPLDDETKQRYIDAQFSANPDDSETALKRVLLMTLKSPRFLFPEIEHPQLDAYAVATRLSLGLWDSLPDEELLRAAASGQLSTPDQLRHQAQRMTADVRSRGKLRNFFAQWLRTDRFQEMSKDAQRFPGFDAALVSDLRSSLDVFLDETLWGERADFRQLLVSDAIFLNGRLASYYGASLPEANPPDGAPFEKVTLDGGQRAGLLTHPYLLAGYAYSTTTSPIHRGVFIARSVLGRALRPPPEAVTPLPPELHADLNTRERISLQTNAESCQSCHRMINPLGFAFEHFDAVGRYRAEEQGRPIDSTGVYFTRNGEEVKFANVRELAAYLANSPESHKAFIQQLFHELVKQPIAAYGPETLETLHRSFVANEFDVRKLMAEMMVVTALQPRSPARPQPEPASQTTAQN